jgi:hypothetical protein
MTYFAGAAAEAAEFAASAAALAAFAESAAEEAELAASEAAAGAVVVSAAGAGGASVLAQAPSTNATTKALRASLVFIYDTPEYLWIKRYRQTCCLGLAPKCPGRF